MCLSPSYCLIAAGQAVVSSVANPTVQPSPGDRQRAGCLSGLSSTHLTPPRLTPKPAEFPPGELPQILDATTAQLARLTEAAFARLQWRRRRYAETPGRSCPARLLPRRPRRGSKPCGAPHPEPWRRRVALSPSCPPFPPIDSPDARAHRSTTSGHHRGRTTRHRRRNHVRPA